jgi:hypothetical protein
MVELALGVVSQKSEGTTHEPFILVIDPFGPVTWYPATVWLLELAASAVTENAGMTSKKAAMASRAPLWTKKPSFFSWVD